jgi:hypothetical protein
MQCHDSFRGAKLPRSNQKRGKQAEEHDLNQRGTNEPLSNEVEETYLARSGQGWIQVAVFDRVSILGSP